MPKRTMHEDTEDYEGESTPVKPSRLKKRECTVTEYDYYLTGSIGAASDYIELCDLLRNASHDDQINIRINSNGGLVAAGNQIINAINESDAHVHGYIESECGSMATMVFLACHSWSLSPHTEFFVHTTSGGCFGKEPETYNHAVFTRKRTHQAIRDCYTGFLTESEIGQVLAGGDLYFDAAEVAARLKVYRDSKNAVNETVESFPERLKFLKN